MFEFYSIQRSAIDQHSNQQKLESRHFFLFLTQIEVSRVGPDDFTCFGIPIQYSINWSEHLRRESWFLFTSS